MTGHIYLIRNLVNGKCYVGKTEGSVLDRYRRHLQNAKWGIDYALYRAIRKYGENSFSIDHVASCEALLINDLEKYYIEFYGSRTTRHGYNMTEGGDGLSGLIFSEEHRKKLSDAAKRRKRGKLSDETCEKIRKALKGKSLSAEHCAKLSESHSGKKRKPLSEKTKLKIAAAHVGMKHSDVSKLKMAVAQTGKKRGPRSAETIAKISATKRRKFAELQMAKGS